MSTALIKLFCEEELKIDGFLLELLEFSGLLSFDAVKELNVDTFRQQVMAHFLRNISHFRPYHSRLGIEIDQEEDFKRSYEDKEISDLLSPGDALKYDKFKKILGQQNEAFLAKWQKEKNTPSDEIMTEHNNGGKQEVELKEKVKSLYEELGYADVLIKTKVFTTNGKSGLGGSNICQVSNCHKEISVPFIDGYWKTSNLKRHIENQHKNMKRKSGNDDELKESGSVKRSRKSKAASSTDGQTEETMHITPQGTSEAADAENLSTSGLADESCNAFYEEASEVRVITFNDY